jgi:hypothetical protein
MTSPLFPLKNLQTPSILSIFVSCGFDVPLPPLLAVNTCDSLQRVSLLLNGAHSAAHFDDCSNSETKT